MGGQNSTICQPLMEGAARPFMLQIPEESCLPSSREASRSQNRARIQMKVLTAMHLERQFTSPASQASMQAVCDDWAGVRPTVVDAVSRVVEVVSVDCALAKRAKAPATTKVVKRILMVFVE